MKSTRRYKILFSFLGLIALFSVHNLLPEPSLQEGINIDSLVVRKAQRQLLAYSHGGIVKTYIVALGSNPMGDKEFEGDCRTPEGNYFINEKSAESRFHKNLGISYPNSSDSAHAQELGKQPGGDVKIHGLRNGIGLLGRFHRYFDWTLGCIALTNSEIDELYHSVEVGTPITITP